MTLRVTFAPFTIVTLAAVLVFGVLVPLAEVIYGISADTGKPTAHRGEAERMVSWSWREAERCLESSSLSRARAGRFVFRVEVGATGVVKSVSVLESPDYADPTSDCLIRIVRAWQFERAEKPRSIDLVFDPEQHAYDASFDPSPGSPLDAANP